MLLGLLHPSRNFDEELYALRLYRHARTVGSAKDYEESCDSGKLVSKKFFNWVYQNDDLSDQNSPVD